MNKSKFFKMLTVGTKVQMISFHGDPVPEIMSGIRTVAKVQSNAVKFSNESWLYHDDVKAGDVSEVFTGNNDPSISIGWAIYKVIA